MKIWFKMVLLIQSGAKRTHVFESACDFFLWGYLKLKVYVRKPHTVDDRKVSIREEIASVPQEMLVNVMQNFEERLRTCEWQEGRHLSDIIFRNWVIKSAFITGCFGANIIFYIENKKVTIIWENAFFLRHCIYIYIYIIYIFDVTVWHNFLGLSFSQAFLIGMYKYGIITIAQGVS